MFRLRLFTQRKIIPILIWQLIRQHNYVRAKYNQPAATFGIHAFTNCTYVAILYYDEEI
jgi:hypothetical protein